MKKVAFFILLLIFTGCEQEQNGSVRVASSRPDVFKVCLDLDDSKKCEESEPIFVTDEKGILQKSFLSEYSQAVNLVVTEGSVTGRMYLMSDINSDVISPATTLLMFHDLSGSAKSLEEFFKEEKKLQQISELYLELFKMFSAKGLESYDSGKKAYEMIIDKGDSVVLKDGLSSKEPGTYIADPLVLTFRQGFQHGAGLNALSGELTAVNSCIKETASVKTAELNETLLSIDLVTSIDEFLKSMEIELRISFDSINVSGGIYGKFKDISDRDSNSVFAVVKIMAKIADYNIENVELTDEAVKHYVDNYDVFREKCGDLFLNTATTGGAYIGILEIKTGSAYEKLQLEAALRGAYKPMHLEIEASLAYLKEKLSIVSNYTMHVLSTGGISDVITHPSVDSNDKILKSFLENGQKFANALYENYKSGKGVSVNNFTARFEPYHQIINTAPPGLTEAANRNEAISQYDDIYSSYDRVLKSTREILARPWDYEEGKEREQELRETESDLEWFLALVKTTAVMCGKERNDCTYPEDFLKENVLPSALKMENGLPVEKSVYPKNCVERKQYFANRNDEDVYTLFMGGDKNSPFSVYCENMDGDDPQSYIILNNFSPLPAPESNNDLSPMYNFSTKYISGATYEEKAKEITVYRRIKVKINYDNLTIMPVQDKFFESVIMNNFSNMKAERLSLGTATVCGDTGFFDAENNRNLPVVANINVAGTSFCFPNGENRFYVTGYDPALDVEMVVENTSDNISIMLSNNTDESCVSVVPLQDIILEYCGN